MKLAILKFIVYFMGLLLVLVLIFLGFMIAQKIKNPDWSILQKQSLASKNIKPSKQLSWPLKCLNENKKITSFNKDFFIISNPQCHFYDIFDSRGNFINRIKLEAEKN